MNLHVYSSSSRFPGKIVISSPDFPCCALSTSEFIHAQRLVAFSHLLSPVLVNTPLPFHLVLPFMSVSTLFGSC